MKTKIILFFVSIFLGNSYFAQENSTIDTFFYRSANFPKIRTVDFKTDGLLTKRIYFNYNGTKHSEISYKYGKRNGPTILYHENGNIKYTCEYKDDKMSGERMCYDPAGNVSEGNFIFYNNDGTKEREGKCINGKPEGELKLYINNKIVMLVNFKDGKPHGMAYYYDRNQIITLVEEYNNGNFVHGAADKEQAN